MNKPADMILVHPCTHWFGYLLDGGCVLGVCWEYKAAQRLAGITGMSLIYSGLYPSGSLGSCASDG